MRRSQPALHGVALLFALLAWRSAAGVAEACVRPRPVPFEVDPALAAPIDAASEPIALDPSVDLARSVPPARTSCDGSGVLVIDPGISQASLEGVDLGLRIYVSGERPPPGLWLPGGPVRADGTTIIGTWSELAYDLPPLDFTVEIEILDRSGAVRGRGSVAVEDSGMIQGYDGPSDPRVAAVECDRGESSACLWLAKLDSHPLPMASPPGRPDRSYEDLCARGDRWACLYELDRHIPGYYRYGQERCVEAECRRSAERALEALDRGCVTGDGVACRFLGGIRLHLGLDGPEDDPLHHRRGCDLGDAPSCEAVLEYRPDERTEEEADELVRRICEIDPERWLCGNRRRGAEEGPAAEGTDG